MNSIIKSVTAGLGLAAGLGLTAPVAAHADLRGTGDISCTGGSFSLTVSPPFRSQIIGGEVVAQFTGTMDLGLCESASHPKIHHGKLTLKASATAGCDITFITGYVRNGTGQGSITWDTGERSSFANASWQGTLSELQLQHANITDGLLAGGTMELTAKTTANVVSNAVGCSAFGVDRLDGDIREISLSS
jgi:hypothetical protein